MIAPVIPIETMFARSLKTSRLVEPMTATSCSSVPKNSTRTLKVGSDIIELAPSLRLPNDPKDQEGVELLLGIATIVSKEIASSDKQIFDDENGDEFHKRSESSFLEPSFLFDQAPRGSTEFPSSLLRDDDFSWHRIRTVSIDNEPCSPRRISDGRGRNTLKSKPLRLPPAVVTPVGTRLRTIRKPSLKLLANKGKREQIKFPKQSNQQSYNQNLPNIMSQHKHKAVEQSTIKDKAITIIYRKKFSWKNYPELEAFLVANREEYLRHSALNYTIQQKKYNNRLTERLLDLAAEHLYVFNEDEFSFVTVRDRIRCFYKSYVQSSKKRGIVLGYAARKAGILTPADLQKSARKEGTIITPLEL
mmetsp:Transcript_11248/g.23842  ORF Transcript_11248/g.23842 Transcript_11248/m.23842 type:complete len:361 (+) Transcript_11248:40-1122(+)